MKVRLNTVQSYFTRERHHKLYHCVMYIYSPEVWKVLLIPPLDAVSQLIPLDPQYDFDSKKCLMRKERNLRIGSLCLLCCRIVCRDPLSNGRGQTRRIDGHRRD